jgi:hypothetical protein
LTIIILPVQLALAVLNRQKYTPLAQRCLEA